MLGKLIKHELRASYKLIFLTHGFLLLLTLIVGTFLALQTGLLSNDYVSSFAFGIIAFLGGIVYLPVIIVTVFGTQLYIAIRFYRNLFTDEGYLMHTLPVTPAKLLHSKIITAVIWTIFDIIIAIIAGLILFTFYFAYGMGITNIFNTLFSSFSISSLPALGCALITYVYAILMIFACICLGQLFHKHRGLASIIIYFGLNLLIQGIQSFVILAGNTAMNVVTTYLYTASALQAFSMLNIGLTMLVMYIVPAIIFYLICQYIMNKKLNLL